VPGGPLIASETVVGLNVADAAVAGVWVGINGTPIENPDYNNMKWVKLLNDYTTELRDWANRQTDTQFGNYWCIGPTPNNFFCDNSF